jgi:hypothetical protein
LIRSGLSFPVLAFRPDYGRYPVTGRELLTWFVDEEDLSSCGDWELRRGGRLGMVIVDQRLTCWIVEQVIDLGVTKPFWERFWRFLNRQILHRVDQILVQLEPFKLDQVKERVCAALEANPDDWRDDEAIAGEVGPPRDESEMMDERQAGVRAAGSLTQLINFLYGEEFED